MALKQTKTSRNGVNLHNEMGELLAVVETHSENRKGSQDALELRPRHQWTVHMTGRPYAVEDLVAVAEAVAALPDSGKID